MAPSPQWLAQRQALHTRFLDVVGLHDASRLAYLHGPETTWDDDGLVRLWTDALAAHPPVEHGSNHMYVHVPFCKSLCTFCNYERLRPSRASLMEDYLQRVLASMDALAPALEPLTFHALYIGGGTPSVLPAKMLDTLLWAVRNKFRWHVHAARHFEFDPAVLGPTRLEVLQKHEFNYLSFGIQTLDGAVNEAHDRGLQDLALIGKRFESLQAAGLDAPACDFLLGLAGTTPDQIIGELRTVMERFRPRSIDVFLITPTREYVDRHFGGSYEAFWAHRLPFEQQCGPAIEQLAEDLDYIASGGGGHLFHLGRRDLALPDESVTGRKFGYSQQLKPWTGPLNLVAFGPSAKSRVFGHAYYESHDASDSDDDPVHVEYRGFLGGLRGEAMGFLVHHLRDHDRLDRAEFRRLFSVDVTELFADVIAAWEHLGLARVEPVHVVFPPADSPERARTLMWLANPAGLEHQIERRLGFDLSEQALTTALAALPAGEVAATGHARLSFVGPSGTAVPARVAPTAEGQPPRIALLAAPPPGDVDALRKNVARCRKLLTPRRNRLAVV